MSGIIDLYADMLDRTGELMQGRLESISDLAYHTHLDIKWLQTFSRKSFKKSKTWHIANVYQLHNWLMLLELACPIQRYGCNYAMRVLGEAACYIEKDRLSGVTTGVMALNECWGIWRCADARLTGLRELDNWIKLPGDGRAMAALLHYCKTEGKRAS